MTDDSNTPEWTDDLEAAVALFAEAFADTLAKFARQHPEPRGAFRLTVRGDAAFVFRCGPDGVPTLEWVPDVAPGKDPQAATPRVQADDTDDWRGGDGMYI